MAKIIIRGKEKEVKDGESLIEPCQELDVAFGCQTGICGTCEVTVLEGMENLTERTEAELDMGMKDNKRLACQCKIKTGLVQLKYDL